MGGMIARAARTTPPDGVPVARALSALPRAADGALRIGWRLVPTPPLLLQTLLTTPGPSGYEGDVAAVWREAAVGFAEVSSDSLGSSVARVRGTGDGPLLAIVGHIDEIGLHVTH